MSQCEKQGHQIANFKLVCEIYYIIFSGVGVSKLEDCSEETWLIFKFYLKLTFLLKLNGYVFLTWLCISLHSIFEHPKKKKKDHTEE